MAGAFILIPARRGRQESSSDVYWKATQSARDGKQFRLPRIVYASPHLNGREAELFMISQITDNREQIDRKTSRSICDAVGERLQQNFRPESSRLSSHLQHLMDELRKRDR
jgi:hypothetical protein